MTSASPVEHYATLFDSHYLLPGLALHRSLMERAQPFRLWVLCMDDEVQRSLQRLALPGVTSLRLAEVETDALRAVKPRRNVGEYCWTLTPFLPEFVLQREPRVDRVTYIDADLFFFDSPAALFDEFDRSGKHVLITDHAFGPEYAHNLRFGRFCVQFMTFRNTEQARRVMRWWQDRCLEWCYGRYEDGKFGDQKYLDEWPERFGAEVHILEQTTRTVAPWNVAHLARQLGTVQPVFYHFHGVRLFAPGRARLYSGYQVGRTNQWIYDDYVRALRESRRRAEAAGISPRTLALPYERLEWLRRPFRVLQGRARYASV